ncbi:MAG: alkaline phosphatase family protein [Pirellulales bacterium]
MQRSLTRITVILCQCFFSVLALFSVLGLVVLTVGINLVFAQSLVAANPTVSHVIQISVDGLRGDLLADLIASEPLAYPNFKRLTDEGAATFNARAGFFNTRTLPNHASMITSRPVLQPAGMPDTTQHGWTLNSLSANSTVTLHDPRITNLPYVASTFDMAHDHGLSTAFYGGKGKFVVFDNSYNENNGAADTIGADNGRDKIDTYVIDSSANVQNQLVTNMQAANYNYIFLHYADPDGGGHDFGWGSPGWEATVQDVDGYLGELLNLIDTNASLQNDTAIILTADHGGTPLGGHSDPFNPENYTIPVMVWGEGVAAGVDLYHLNPDSRLDPGTGRPAFTDGWQPIRSGDTGNLALDLLGLGPIAGTLINGQQDLSVAVPEPTTLILFGSVAVYFLTSRRRQRLSIDV